MEMANWVYHCQSDATTKKRGSRDTHPKSRVSPMIGLAPVDSTASSPLPQGVADEALPRPSGVLKVHRQLLERSLILPACS